MRLSKRVAEALSATGARLKRAGRHLVFELPNHRNVVVARTPSDYRAEQNMLRDIRQAAGVARPPKAESAPKQKGRKPGRIPTENWGLPRTSSPLATALRQTGLVEHQLRSRIGQLEAQLAAREADLFERDAQLNALERLLVVRVYRVVQFWLAQEPKES